MLVRRGKVLLPILLIPLLLLPLGWSNGAGAGAPQPPPLRRPLPALLSNGETPLYTYRVLQIYPHDPDAFTQGLVYTNSLLYESTGLYGRSSLRKVDLETGQVLQIRNLASSYFGEGIALYGQRILQLTWREHTALLYDRDSFSLLDTFSYPTEGWGLTYDGERLIMSDGSATLYFRDPSTFGQIGQVRVHDNGSPVNRLNELEYIEGEVYANVWLTDRIARIDPQSGRVTGWIDLEGLLGRAGAGLQADVLNGIAYDREAGRLFVTGKLWPYLFEIALAPVGQGPNWGWLQVNEDGFGDADNRAVSVLTTFQGNLYAGTINEGRGAQLWRTADGHTWAQVPTGFTQTAGLDDLAVWSDALYAAIRPMGGAGVPSGGGIWRSDDGWTWSPVVEHGFGQAANEQILPLAPLSGTLYAGTTNPTAGAQVWRSADGLQWEQVAAAGFGRPANSAIGALAAWKGYIYAGTWNETTGAEVWRSDGLTWTSVLSGGLGDPANLAVTALAPFQDRLYALTVNRDDGAQLWRTDDGLTWTVALSGGLGNPRNEEGGGLFPWAGFLYAVLGNPYYGAEVWRTADGLTWEQVGFRGWGDVGNVGPAGARSLALFGNRLFVGTVRDPASPSGGEVWTFPEYRFFLPRVGK